MRSLFRESTGRDASTTHGRPAIQLRIVDLVSLPPASWRPRLSPSTGEEICATPGGSPHARRGTSPR